LDRELDRELRELDKELDDTEDGETDDELADDELLLVGGQQHHPYLTSLPIFDPYTGTAHSRMDTISHEPLK
jgi:hypothetical protein